MTEDWRNVAAKQLAEMRRKDAEDPGWRDRENKKSESKPITTWSLLGSIAVVVSSPFMGLFAYTNGDRAIGIVFWFVGIVYLLILPTGYRMWKSGM